MNGLNPNAIFTKSLCESCGLHCPETDFNRKRTKAENYRWRNYCFGCVCMRLLDQMLPKDKQIKSKKPRRKPFSKTIVMERLVAPVKKRFIK